MALKSKILHQNTKIVATLGPASDSKENLLKLIQAGADVLRLNFSHGNHENKKEIIQRIQEINEEHGLHIGILGDLQGPKLRVGEMKDGGVEVKTGEKITFVNTPCVGTIKKTYMSYESFAADVQVGEKVLCDDGKLEFVVAETDGKSKVVLEATFGGILKSNKGVNLPDTKLSLPSLTKKDIEDLKFILTQPINWVALSFVREAKDIVQLRDFLVRGGHKAKIIAKIEKPEAVLNIKDIIKETDAVMIARGDLGVEVPLEQVPSIQKRIISMCIQKAKPTIVATQMMESMITNPSPTRAEVADVANAVLDGTDAVMLSGETSVGMHPDVVVQHMSRIIAEAEKNYELQDKRPKPNRKSVTYNSDTICINAAKIASDIRAKAISGLTISGHTAFRISSYRPKSRIFIFSPEKHMLATMNLIWGVKSFYYDKFTTTDDTIEDIAMILKKHKHVKVGDSMVNTGSMPLHKRPRTNMLKITVIE